jgi:hypothetical protein
MADNCLEMTQVFKELNAEGDLDRHNVSIHSAFICILHLANEKGLMFNPVTPGSETDFTIKIM